MGRHEGIPGDLTLQGLRAHALRQERGGGWGLPTLSLSHCLLCTCTAEPAPPARLHTESLLGPEPIQACSPHSHQRLHMQRTSSLTNTQHGFPLTPLNITPTFTHSHTHTPTHTSCLYTDTHNSIHQDQAQPKHRSLARTRRTAPTLSLLGFLLSCPQQGRTPSPVRGHAGEAGDTKEMGLKRKKDSVEHSVSQSSSAVGESGRYPW